MEKRGWGGLGCHEWSSVDMVMSLFLCVFVCACVFRCVLHLRLPVVLFFSVLFHFCVCFLSLCLSGCRLCWRERSSAIRWEREVHSEYPFIVVPAFFFTISLSLPHSSGSHLFTIYAFLRIYLFENFCLFLLDFRLENELPICATHYTTQCCIEAVLGHVIYSAYMIWNTFWVFFFFVCVGQQFHLYDHMCNNTEDVMNRNKQRCGLFTSQAWNHQFRSMMF